MSTELSTHGDDSSSGDSSDKRVNGKLTEMITNISQSLRANRVSSSKSDALKLNYRNSLKSFIKLMDVLKPRDVHINVLKDIPFWNFIDLVLQKKIVVLDVLKNSKFLDEIISSFDKEKNVFVFKEKEFVFDAKDVAAIFGLPLAGIKVDTSKRTEKTSLGLDESAFLDRCFNGRKDKINKKSIQIALKKSMEGNEEEDHKDVARLIVAYLLCTFFLSSSMNFLQICLLPSIVSFAKMKEVSWPATIESHLMKQICAFSHQPRRVTACTTSLLVGKSSEVDDEVQGLREKVRTLEAEKDEIQKKYDILRTQMETAMDKPGAEDDELTMQNSMSSQSPGPSQSTGLSQPPSSHQAAHLERPKRQRRQPDKLVVTFERPSQKRCK